MAEGIDFTLVQLRYFVTAAETGSMTAAAERLVVSQSAVSTAVAQLERHLGVQLFVRHHARGLSLTRAGDRFLSEARAFLGHAEELAEAGRSLGTALSGTLTVGCFVSLAPFYLPRLLGEFAAHHPAVRVRVVEGETERLRRALHAGECELALLYDFDLGEPIETRLLTTAQPYVIVPRGHRLANAAGVRRRDLAGEPMVLLDWPYSSDYFLALLGAAGVQPVIAHRSSSYETVRALVAAGHGFSLLNQRPATDVTYDGGSVVPLPLLDPVPGLPVVLGRLRGVRPTRRAAAFAECCRRTLAGTPAAE